MKSPWPLPWLNFKTTAPAWACIASAPRPDSLAPVRSANAGGRMLTHQAMGFCGIATLLSWQHL